MVTTTTSPSSSVTPLPSLDECTRALTVLLNDAAADHSNDAVAVAESSVSSLEEWRKLIQSCLSHGTSCDRLPRRRGGGGKENESSSLRAEAAGDVLCGALEWYYSNRGRSPPPSPPPPPPPASGRPRRKPRWSEKKKKKTKKEDDDDDADAVAAGNNNPPRKHSSGRKDDSSDDDPVVHAVVEALWLAGCLLDEQHVVDETAAAATPGDEGGAKNNNNAKRVPHECLLAIIKKLTEPRPRTSGEMKEEEEEEEVEDRTSKKKKEAGVGTNAEDAMEVDETDDAAKNLLLLRPLVPITSLQGALELSLLDAARLLPSAPPVKAPPPNRRGGAATVGGVPASAAVLAVDKRLKKINTDMYYRQHKFNLMAEESEGYAKLWTFLAGGCGGGAQGGARGGGGGDDVDVDAAAATVTAGARRRVRELVGAFDLDPNRALDLALDALEWELNGAVARSSSASAAVDAAGSKSSFSELSKLAASDDKDGGWWGLERVRSALAKIEGEGEGGDDYAIRSLLAIVRELDGTSQEKKKEDEDGEGGSSSSGEEKYEGRAVAHLLGFKYRSYHARAAARKAAQSAGTGTGKDGGATIAVGGNGVYPRSLHLSTAFLCARGALDPHALLPHVIGIRNSAAGGGGGGGKDGKSDNAKKKPAAASSSSEGVATPLMGLYKKHCAETVKRLKKLGVVSLNSKKGDASNKKEDASDAAGDDAPLRDDPVVGIYRAMLATSGDWDPAAAFLAHAATGPAFFASKDDVVAGMRSTMDSATAAACAMCEGVASDVAAWANCAVGDVRGEAGKTGGRGESSSAMTTFRALEGDASLAETSSVLRDPLSALARSGRIRKSRDLYVKLCRLYGSKLTPSPKSSSSSSDGSNDDGIVVESPEEGEIDPTLVDADTLAVLSSFLVPSLSLFPSDATLSADLWSVLRRLPYALRYELYGAWRRPGLEKGTLRSLSPAAIAAGDIPKPLGMIESEIETGVAARYVLKRISKENIAERGKQLARTSHNNPLVVFTDILGKIESYDNLILMMVDTFQFVTPLGLDVMGFCLLVSLGGGGEEIGQRSRTKMGGLDTEQWLASLETFTGAFYKKFPSVELRGILVYITRRFAAGRASELGVLRSLIKTAGGYGFVDHDSTSALSDLQLDGRCGSRLLKRETSSFGVVDDIDRGASQRLRSVLQGDDLGAILLILLSQLRARALYSRPSSNTVKEHVKVIGSTYDDCEAVLCLLLEYLSDSSMDASAKEKFAASMPSLGDLHEKYGIDAAVAWMLCRPLVRKSMFYMDDAKLLAAAGSGEGGAPSSEKPPAYLEPFAASSPEMRNSYRGLLPEAAWENIAPAMFETFYSLAVYDIVCPEERYNVDIDRLGKECERLTQLQTGGAAARGQMSVLAAAAAAAGGNYEQVRRATVFTKEHAAELDRLKRNVDTLSKDFRRQKKRCELVLAMLEGQKELLIVETEELKKEEAKEEEESNASNKNNSKFASAFMTFCIYPRCFLSPEDSLYCAHFVKLLHKIKVPGFLTIELIDNIVNAVTGSLYCMTEDEAGNCSIFFNEIWKSVNSWRYDNDAFASELKDTPGSQLSRDFSQENCVGIHSLTSGITHDDYKAIYSQWHQKIGSAAIGCLRSSEYMHTRAALIVLSRIVQVFPTQPKTGDRILETLLPLQGDDNNARPDIRATAQGYGSQLTKARDEGMWKEENIAVTKARQEKEKSKAEERKKKLAKQHEDMKKESEMLARKLGENNGRDSWRPRDDRQRQPWGADRGMHLRGPPPPPPPPLNAVAPMFTPKSGDPRELHGRPGADPSRGRSGMDHGEVWERDRGGGGSGVRQSNDGRGRQTGGVESSSRGGERRKRSRSPEPGEDTEQHQRGLTQKRFRGGERGDWTTPHRRGDPSGSGDPQQTSSRGGARRSDRRGGTGSNRNY